MKAGKCLYKDLCKSTIKDEDRLKGKENEGEKFQRYLKEIQNQGNFKNVLTFTANGKHHDLVNAPEITSIDELVNYNNTKTWIHDYVASTQGQMVKLSDKAKTSKEGKEQLRKSIDLRAKNQIELN